MKKYLVIVANFVAPGIGTLAIGDTVRGALQLLISTLGVLLWMSGSLRLAAIPLILFAWIWAMIAAFRYKQRVELDEMSPVAIAERMSLQREALQRRRGR